MQKSSPNLHSENLVIRPAGNGDIARLIELERQAELAAHWSEAQYRELLAPENSRRIVLVGEISFSMVGFAVVRIIEDEAELENIVVRADMRRRRIGLKLLQALLQSAQEEGLAAFLLEVREFNRAARALYNDVGLKEIGRRNGYYQNPAEDAILYRFSFENRSTSENDI